MTTVHPSNVDTARGWDGPTGDFWVEKADMFDAGVARYSAAFLDAAAIEPTSRVLDVGCGNGETARDAARLAPAGHVTGVDLSARMLELARRRAAGLANIDFVQADAQVADLGRFDRVISRTGVMFFGDPVAAFTNLARALGPGGRMALAVWQRGPEQEWISSFRRAVGAAPLPADAGPFSLGDPDRIRALLAAAGFAAPEIVGVREPMYYGPDLATAEAMVSGLVGGLLDGLDAAARAAAADSLRADLTAHLGADGVTYGSAMWIVTAAPFPVHT